MNPPSATTLYLMLALMTAFAVIAALTTRKFTDNKVINAVLTVGVLAAIAFVAQHFVYQQWYLEPNQERDNLVEAVANSPFEDVQVYCALDDFDRGDLERMESTEELFKEHANVEPQINISNDLLGKCGFVIGRGSMTAAEINEFRQAFSDVFPYHLRFS